MPPRQVRKLKLSQSHKALPEMLLLNGSYQKLWYGLFCLLFIATSVIAEEMQTSLVFYALKVNGQDMGMGQILRSESGGYFARAEDFENWGLNKVELQPLKFMNENYYPLDKVEGYKSNFDEINQELSVEFNPKAFKPALFGNPVEMIIPNPPESGGYANYDLYGTSGSSQSVNQTQLNGQFEVGVFSPLGAGFSSFNGQNLYINSKQFNTTTRLIRLETNWVRDFSEKRQSLKFGDSNGRSGVWGRPMRFGGVQFGTNFATQPGFVTIPLPSFAGESALPSTADVYLNGIRMMSQGIMPGSFQLNNFPFITGSGEAKIVVRDMLGREQVITQPFYVTSNLLRPGVEDYTVELGFIRNNFGMDNANYGRPMAVGTQRKGFSDKLTAEWRAEVLPDQQTAGLSAIYIPPLPVALTAAVAASTSRKGSGDFLLLGMDHQSFGGINFGVRGQFASKYFTQIGSDIPGQSRQFSATMGLFTQSASSFGVSYNYRKNANPPRSESLVFNYSKTIGGKASVNVSVFRSLSGPPNQMVNMFLAYPLDDGVFSSGSVMSQQGKVDVAVQVQKSPPYGKGVGYRALVGEGSQGQREEAGVTLQTDYGAYIVEAGRIPGMSSYRASANGSVGFLGGNFFLSRRSYDSFAVAHVPGFADVPVYLNGQLAAHTDSEGYAILPGLMSYQKNRVMIDIKDLPFGSQIGKTEAEVVPRYHSGVSLKFSVELSIGALIKLVAENGKPLPTGTVLVLEGTPDEFQVALQGEAYITGLAKKNKMKATWNNQSCDFELNLPENPGPLPHIGPILCKGIQP